MIEKILANGYAYEVDGNVYFDVVKYNKDHAYGKLSGRNIEDMMSNTRELDGQSEKRNAVDFALWKKHLQSILCGGLHHGLKVFRLVSRMFYMSTKYLGNSLTFMEGEWIWSFHITKLK